MQQQGQQGVQAPQEDDKQKEEKKRKKAFALKPQHFESEKGLQKLYELTNQINWDDSMTIESAMNLVTMTLKTWHNQFTPKYTYDYFLQRCQALGSHKLTTAYMNRVRRIHKGLEQWDHAPDRLTSNHLQRLEIAESLGRNGPMNHLEGIESEPMNPLGTDLKEPMNNLSLGDEVDAIMEEDLKMFEQMNRNKKLQEMQVEEQGIDLECEQVDFEPYDYE